MRDKECEGLKIRVQVISLEENPFCPQILLQLDSDTFYISNYLEAISFVQMAGFARSCMKIECQASREQ